MISEMMSEVSVNVIERQVFLPRNGRGTDTGNGSEKLNVGTIPKVQTLRIREYVIFCTKKAFLSNVLFGKMQKKPKKLQAFFAHDKKT